MFEIVEDPSRGFRRVGGYGVSPIGEFPDWNVAPAPARRALDTIVGCLEDKPLPAFPTSAPEKEDTPEEGGGPWLLLAGLVGLLLLVANRVKRGARRDLAAASLLAVATLGWRVALIEPTFWHMNGQGALWVESALHSQVLASYGPGQYEVFGWAANLNPDAADRWVFGLQAVIGALVPAAAYGVARMLGARPLLSLGAALALSFEPLMARLSLSESYFGTATGLAWLAALCLALGLGSRSYRDRSFLLSVLAAGLFVSQAARVHPVGWVPLGCLPVIALVAPGRSRGRIVQTVVAGLGIALVLGVSSGGALHGVLTGELGEQWMKEGGGRAVLLLPALAALIGALAVLVRLRSWRAPVAALAVLVGVGLLIRATNLLSHLSPWIAGGTLRVASPGLFAAALVLVVSLGRRTFTGQTSRRRQLRWALPVVTLAIGLNWSVSSWAKMMARPTDMLEATWCTEWREKLAPSEVIYLSRLGKHVLFLPIYKDRNGNSVQTPVIVRDGESLDPPPVNRASNAIYYRSSVCATERGSAVCRELESSYELELIEERSLPKLESTPWIPLGEDPVRVGLYRIKPAR